MAFVVAVSCHKETTEGLSLVTNYAVFEYDALVVVEVGDDYTPTVNATENGQSIAVGTSSNVDTNTVGIYGVTFSATNSDGFEASVFQTVVVHDPDIVGTDVSGDIWDKGNNSRTGVISLVEGTTSIFYATDFGFAGAFPVYFQMDGDVISEIPQTYAFDVSSVDLTYDPVTREFTTLINPQGFGYTFEYQN
ncbi:immunoglobulin-like domain-containing protein [Flagellimonas sp.]|uniref:immunoglobulin-like domain-containing protein n=1 Tax=Flagellimonas sp. TaxID=2058762 RepID=UPI003AB3B660